MLTNRTPTYRLTPDARLATPNHSGAPATHIASASPSTVVHHGGGSTARPAGGPPTPYKSRANQKASAHRWYEANKAKQKANATRWRDAHKAQANARARQNAERRKAAQHQRARNPEELQIIDAMAHEFVSIVSERQLRRQVYKVVEENGHKRLEIWQDGQLVGIPKAHRP